MSLQRLIAEQGDLVGRSRSPHVRLSKGAHWARVMGPAFGSPKRALLTSAPSTSMVNGNRQSVGSLPGNNPSDQTRHEQCRAARFWLGHEAYPFRATRSVAE